MNTNIEKVINNFPHTDKWIFTVNKEVYDHEVFINFYEKFNSNKPYFYSMKLQMAKPLLA